MATKCSRISFSETEEGFSKDFRRFFCLRQRRIFSEFFSRFSASASASASVYKDHEEEADTRIMRRSALDDTLARLLMARLFMDWARLLMARLLKDWAHLLRVRLFRGPTRLCKLSRH
ncbi:unnamed protein product [Camellia sinensis]